MKVQLVDGEFRLFFDRDEADRAIAVLEQICDEYEDGGTDASQIRWLILCAKNNPTKIH